MDRDQLLELVPHYVAMVVIVLVVLTVVRETVGDLGFWIELGIVVVLVFCYRPVVRVLDLEPSAWQSG